MPGQGALDCPCARSRSGAEAMQFTFVQWPWLTPRPACTRRGLRVRCGLHSGISEAGDAVTNKTSGRVQYGGVPLATAKAVGDCGRGGMVLLSQVRCRRGRG